MSIEWHKNRENVREKKTGRIRFPWKTNSILLGHGQIFHVLAPINVCFGRNSSFKNDWDFFRSFLEKTVFLDKKLGRIEFGDFYLQKRE